MSTSDLPHAPEWSDRGPWGAPAPASLPKLPPLKAQTPQAEEASRIEFTESSSAFLGLVIRGAWLQLFTFGFYRFWLTTDIRRHFWSRTIVDGDGAEYTGTARELLFGFLFAMAVLTPVYLLYFLVGIEAERYKAFASVPLFLFLILFGQFALYRARRYRLSRTIWRGLRFWMSGSGWNYAFRSFGWLMLAVATLGLLHPWRLAALERYKLRHTFYGDVQGSFDARAWDLFKRGVWLWLIALIPAFSILAAFVQIGLAMQKGVNSGVAMANAMPGAMLTLLIVPVLWPFYQAIEWRWWASGVNLGGARLRSTVRGGQLFGLYVKFLLAAMLFSIVAGIVLSVAGAVLYVIAHSLLGIDVGKAVEATASSYPYAGIAVVFFVYLAMALAYGVVQSYFLQYWFWDIICDSMSVENVHALDGARNDGKLAGSLGEGLADGLDVGGF
ncbi:MAG: YjgN family protein [Beijerinckiaceae bacterium]